MNYIVERLIAKKWLFAFCSWLLFFNFCILCLDAASESLGHIVSEKKTQAGNKKLEKSESETKKEKINEDEFSPVLLGALLDKPQGFVGSKIKFRGKFSSFTTLALDYEPALRKSKDYISICIFRPDSKVPLSELKLAFPVKEAKDDPVVRELEEGDLLEIYGEVFSAALDEPWVDIVSLKKLSSSLKEDETSKVAKQETTGVKTGKNVNEKGIKKKKNKQNNI